VSRRPPIWRDSLFFRVLEPPGGWETGREGVQANQRARMLDAMTRCVASKGYARVSVADVVQNAGVSRRTFYEQFRDKEDCFLVAYDTGSDAVIQALLAAVAELQAPDWRSTLRTALQTYTTVLAADPEFAHAFLIDVLGAGPQAVERRKNVNERFVEQYRLLAAVAAREEGAEPVPDLFLRALVGGLSELVELHILAHGAETLTDLTDDLVALVNALFAGAAGAAPATR
jgi:AcrR family transcriptional regulator